MKHIYSLYILILLLTSIFSQEKYEEKIIYFPIQLYFDSFCTTIYMGEPAQKTFLPLEFMERQAFLDRSKTSFFSNLSLIERLSNIDTKSPHFQLYFYFSILTKKIYTKLKNIKAC